MDKQYYVQIIAENYLKNVIDEPTELKVHNKFLHTDREQFADGFAALLSLIRQLYGDIAKGPADFGMALKEIADIDAKNADYTNSNASFLRVPNLLLILGAFAKLESDMTLAIDGGTLAAEAKKLKITGLALLLAKLREYGFEISDFGKAPKAGETLTISYIDNRQLTAALKAMADALMEMNKGDLKSPKNNYFYMMHNGLLENETVKEPALTVDFIYHILDPIQREYAVTLHKAAADTTKQTLRMGGFMRNDWSCTYTGKKNKKVLMSLKVDQNNLSVKLNLQNIAQYIPLVAEMPESIQNVIRSGGWECGQCNPRCSGGFAFEIDGKAHNKCHCGSFVFGGLTEEDVECCKTLLEKEINFQ